MCVYASWYYCIIFAKKFFFSKIVTYGSPCIQVTRWRVIFRYDAYSILIMWERFLFLETQTLYSAVCYPAVMILSSSNIPSAFTTPRSINYEHRNYDPSIAENYTTTTTCSLCATTSVEWRSVAIVAKRSRLPLRQRLSSPTKKCMSRAVSRDWNVC